MLIKFSLANFLSFNQMQTFSMEAGKARKNSKRVYKDKHIKLTKCEAIFGANASGKSNLIEAFQFVLLKTGSIQREYLYEITPTNVQRQIFCRNLLDGTFFVGDYFKATSGIEKLNIYGEDSIADSELLFLSIINHGKARMYEDNPELRILRKVYVWFGSLLTVSNPDSILTGYPYFSHSNLNEIANLLNALGTGIFRIWRKTKQEMKSMTLPSCSDLIKNFILLS